MTEQSTQTTGLTRRDILKRGAVFGGALVWATPIVQVVGMSPAHARPVSPGCTRYCIKWETDGNARILDTGTGGFAVTCDEDELDIWTSFWVGLGGSNADEADDTEEVAAFSSTEESTTTSSTTTSTTVEGTSEEGDGEEADGESDEDLEDETGESGGESQLSGAAEASDSSEHDSEASNELTQSQNNGRNGPPEGTPGGPPTDHPGNCIECDTGGSENSSAAAQQLADSLGIEVYGDPATGFYVSIPSDCSLADLEEEGLDAAAVKVGGPGGGGCSVVVSQEPDPCRPGYTRIVLPNPEMRYDISHIELIIDCCE